MLFQPDEIPPVSKYFDLERHRFDKQTNYEKSHFPRFSSLFGGNDAATFRRLVNFWTLGNIVLMNRQIVSPLSAV
jgi:hypothetical protein